MAKIGLADGITIFEFSVDVLTAKRRILWSSGLAVAIFRDWKFNLNVLVNKILALLLFPSGLR